MLQLPRVGWSSPVKTEPPQIVLLLMLLVVAAVVVVLTVCSNEGVSPSKQTNAPNYLRAMSLWTWLPGRVTVCRAQKKIHPLTHHVDELPPVQELAELREDFLHDLWHDATICLQTPSDSNCGTFRSFLPAPNDLHKNAQVNNRVHCIVVSNNGHVNSLVQTWTSNRRPAQQGHQPPDQHLQQRNLHSFRLDTHNNGHVQNLTQELHCGICVNAQFALCVLVSAGQLKLEHSVDESTVSSTTAPRTLHDPLCRRATGESPWSAEQSGPWGSAFDNRNVDDLWNSHDLHNWDINHRVEEQLVNLW